MDELEHKLERLESTLGQLRSLLVAFSGGVDSTFLLAVAVRVMADRVHAATAVSPIHPSREIEFAGRFARQLGVGLNLVKSREMRQEDFLVNPQDRCYVCKKNLIVDLQHLAGRLNIENIAHGANLDDLDDYRPGFEAARRAGILAPLIEARMRKDDIRALSRRLGLITWNKPSMACLASRIPYGERISREKLERIDRAETFLRDLGFSTCRVRHHGTLARIELDPDQLPRMMQPEVRYEVFRQLRRLGFVHVALDLEGYQQGSLNRVLDIT